MNNVGIYIDVFMILIFFFRRSKSIKRREAKGRLIYGGSFWGNRRSRRI
jgi:hypothetical protein